MRNSESLLKEEATPPMKPPKIGHPEGDQADDDYLKSFFRYCASLLLVLKLNLIRANQGPSESSSTARH